MFDCTCNTQNSLLFCLFKKIQYDYTFLNKGVAFNVILDSASLELASCRYECVKYSVFHTIILCLSIREGMYFVFSICIETPVSLK